MTARCLSTLVDLEEEGYSARALARLADRRKVPHILGLTRRDILQFRTDKAAHLSISGVQDKISLRLSRGRFEPTDVGGEFILKPVPSVELPRFHSDVPANEHLTMQLAEQLFGIRTAANGLIRLADGELAYLTRRFDRRRDGSRIAQEDFCQLMTRSAQTHGRNYKYDSSYQALGHTLRRFCAAYEVEVEELFRRLVFSYAVGNGDAHLKNFSLQQSPWGDYLLSPAYDLVSSTLHLQNESRLALDMFDGDEVPAGVAELGFETGGDFRELARRFGIKERRAQAVIDRVADLRGMVRGLVGRSFITDGAAEGYLAIFEDRLVALDS